MRGYQCFLLVVLGIHAVVSIVFGCKTDVDCSLNGVCDSGSCACDKPWSGPACGMLAYKTTPISGKSLFPLNKSHNTWNGPNVGPVDGKYHLYDPYYGNYTGVKSLFRVEYIMHGTADNISGPYTWGVQPNIPGGINPAFLVYNDRSTGKTQYTLWNGNIRTSESPYGPWTTIPGRGDCGTNRAPVFHDGVFYCTSQRTTQIYTTAKLGDTWETYSDINVTLSNGTNVSYASQFETVEDPFLWIDHRGNWHIINHRYNTSEIDHCGSSTISAHTFSPDGKEWHVLEPAVEPYTHTVHYDDGTSFTFVTLERPNLHFNEKGQLTHINLAVDLVTPDAVMYVGEMDFKTRSLIGCNSADAGNPKACAECKFYNHCGTTIIALDV